MKLKRLLNLAIILGVSAACATSGWERAEAQMGKKHTIKESRIPSPSRKSLNTLGATFGVSNTKDLRKLAGKVGNRCVLHIDLNNEQVTCLPVAKAKSRHGFKFCQVKIEANQEFPTCETVPQLASIKLIGKSGKVESLQKVRRNESKVDRRNLKLLAAEGSRNANGYCPGGWRTTANTTWSENFSELPEGAYYCPSTGDNHTKGVRAGNTSVNNFSSPYIFFNSGGQNTSGIQGNSQSQSSGSSATTEKVDDSKDVNGCKLGEQYIGEKCEQCKDKEQPTVITRSELINNQEESMLVTVNVCTSLEEQGERSEQKVTTTPNKTQNVAVPVSSEQRQAESKQDKARCSPGGTYQNAEHLFDCLDARTETAKYNACKTRQDVQGCDQHKDEPGWLRKLADGVFDTLINPILNPLEDWKENPKDKAQTTATNQGRSIVRQIPVLGPLIGLFDRFLGASRNGGSTSGANQSKGSAVDQEAQVGLECSQGTYYDSSLGNCVGG